MAESTTQEVEYADYYQCTAGYTVGMTVCQEGEVVTGEAMGFTEANPPLDEQEQIETYGQVMYREYEPDEDDDVAAIQRESATIKALQGMNDPNMPPVTPAPGAAEVPLDTLGRQQLRQKARSLGLKFPEDTDRDQMIGAIQKKQQEAAGARTEEENEVLERRRENAKKAIEEANDLIQSGGSGPAGRSAPSRPRQSRQETPPEQEETTSA
jgi:hypothetical protein